MLFVDETNVTGGATVHQGILTWLPSCSRTTESDIHVGSAQNFDLTTTSYITDVRTRLQGSCAGWELGQEHDWPCWHRRWRSGGGACSWLRLRQLSM